MRAKVTIAIALYNNSPYVQRCLGSVVHQTYDRLEILIVDDGSTDDSRTKCTSYLDDSRVHLISKENGGLSSARQKALEIATGDYICFIDADDYLDPEYVEMMILKMQADNSQICVCSTRFEDSQGNFITDDSRIFACDDSVEPFRTTPDELSLIDNPRVGALHLSDSWDKMFQIQFLREADVRFCMPKGLNGTDMLFNMLVAIHRPVYSTIRASLYNHVVYKQSAVHRNHKNLMATYIFITQELISESKNLKMEDELSIFISNFYIRGVFNSCMDTFDESKNLYKSRNAIKEIIIRNNDFFKDKPYLMTAAYPFQPCRLKLFVHLLKSSPVLLVFYFYIRRAITKIR